jgi:hypothetical protein
MIVTYRDTEVAPASLAADAIAGLARGPGRRRCELAGLGPDSVAQWLDAAGLADVDPAGLHARTGGNPLFIAESIELLTSGARPDAPLRSVGEVIRERLTPLPPACREALEVAAVLGRDFEYPPLAAALRISPAATVAALDPAVHARLAVPPRRPGRVTPARWPPPRWPPGTRWPRSRPITGWSPCSTARSASRAPRPGRAPG